MRDLLPAYAHEALDAVESARVAAHLADCEACRFELALVERSRDAMRMGVPRVDVAAIVAALPLASRPMVRRAERSAAARWALRPVWQYAAAAGLVLVAGTGIVWQRTAGDGRARLADSTLVRSAGPTRPAQATRVAHPESGIGFGGGLSDLSVDELQSLLGQMDTLRALPSTDPASMTPVIAMN
jgi:anti-sigma factor RsiW